MGFIAGIIGIGWLVEHIKEVLIVIGIIVALIIYRRHVKIKQYQAYQAKLEADRLEKERQAKAAAEREARIAAQKAAEEEEKRKSEANRITYLPDEIDGKFLVYRYMDVCLDSPNTSIAELGDAVSFQDNDDIIQVIQGRQHIGNMPQNNLSKMIRDWNISGDPVYSFVNKVTSGRVEIALGFYQDTISKFLSRNPDAKLVKLIGKPDELAFYNKGETCEVEHDLDTDHYLVTRDGVSIGRLPASAVTYAEKHEIEPDELEIMIAEVDYDVEKDRDIISVYISK